MSRKSQKITFFGQFYYIFMKKMAKKDTFFTFSCKKKAKLASLRWMLARTQANVEEEEGHSIISFSRT